ncbi:histidyl-tRNA synthetase [Robiginitalea myxolifaciens]|uniref:Histidine--tRNA ligase n=1 Tax=Robiginitalea myxolifaciens TaxID=400055 RepID=A0A1I6FML6_9FLAO|nr:histidine--tRNA ligase [Robiginitalea myxolifaciens]SFR31179.1 histidyl-tRNA synthetase [Robiginitalea myxolifaciens]
MAQKPGIPKGTRDFGPGELARRYYIIEVIREAFERFGFQPIETPSFENYDTLMGKYGDEGDRLIFKILNSGDFLSKVGADELAKGDANSLTPKISEKALRYDLTVPFARYVVMHQNELDFPFKRYQIQPVWRADRPQRGRFREFFQCDADVVGATGILQELEFVQLYDRVFDQLGLKGVTIKINHRKVLAGIAEVIGASDKLIDFTVALDKLDKIGAAGVEKEMLGKGLAPDAVEKVKPLLDTTMDAMGRFEKLEELLSDSEVGQEGLADLRSILEQTDALGLRASTLVPDVTLARGLNYYTGAIFEVAAPEGVEMGSIGGGGRYDDLTGIFGLKDLSGVGISFGLDRIYLVMEQLGLFPPSVDQQLDVFCINFGEAEAKAAFKLVLNLRSKGVRTDIYPNAAKVGKQFKYADKRGVPRVILIGDEELKAGNFTVREMKSGEQATFSMAQWEDFAAQLLR